MPETPEDQILATLLQTAPTLGEAFRQLRLLRSFLEYRFYTTSDMPSTIDAFCRERSLSSEDAAIFTTWGEQFYEMFNKNNAYKLLNTVSEMIKKLPTLRLYVPVKLGRKDEVGILSWFREHVHENMLLDIRLDPERVGGCAIAWGGIYRDYSLHRHIVEKAADIKAVISKHADQNT